MDRTVPSPPELVAPVQGAPVRGDAAKLVWHPVEDATGYHVQVSTDEDFHTLLVDTRLGTVSSAIVQHIRGKDQTLFWRVAAQGVGGQSAYSETGEFLYSHQPAEAPYAGLTAEAGAETGLEGARKDPAPVRRFNTGGGEYLLLVAAVLLSALVVAATFIVFPGLGSDPEPGAQQASADSARVAEQARQNAELNSFTADSAGYTIPIDSAISRLAVPTNEPVVLVDEGQ